MACANPEFIIACLTEIEAHGKVPSHLGLKAVAATALDQMRKRGSDTPAQCVLLVVVVGLRAQKATLSETCLACLHHMLTTRLLPAALVFDQVFTSSAHSVVSGKPAVWALLEALSLTLTVRDLAVQQKTLDCIAACALDLRFDVSGAVLSGVLKACFNLHLTTENNSIRCRSKEALENLVSSRVLAVFTTEQAEWQLPAFQLSCDCDDDVTQYAKLPVPFCTLPPLPLRQGTKDLLTMLATLLDLASRSLPATLTSPDAVEVRTREFALQLLVHSLRTPMDAWTEQATAKVAAASHRLFTPLWHCVNTNLATVAPPSLFVLGAELLEVLWTGHHYLLRESLRRHLDLVVAPLLKSKLSTFTQKMSLLKVFRAVSSSPGLLVSLFINHDCLVAHDRGSAEAIFNMVTDTLFLSFHPASRADPASCEELPLHDASEETVHPAPWSVTQQELLRLECCSILEAFAVALRRWLSDPADDISVEHSWRSLHQLHFNKQVVARGIAKVNQNWKHGREFLVSHGVLEDTCEDFVQFIRYTPKINRGQLCTIFEKVLKESFALDVLRVFMGTFDFTGVPLDEALRDTTLSFMSWDGRPQFEAQVWAMVQEVFGQEYSRQNDGNPSARDSDALAGVILFVHTNLHNDKVIEKISIEAFLRNGGECLEHPLPTDEMAAMYHRVAERKWVPEHDKVASALKLHDEADKEPFHREPSEASLRQAAEWGGRTQQYAEHMAKLGASERQQLLYIQLARECAATFTVAVPPPLKTEMRMPYVRPHHAHHAQPLLLQLFPFVAASARFLQRSATNPECCRVLARALDALSDVAGAFGRSTGELHHSAEECLRQALRQEHTSDLRSQPDLAPIVMTSLSGL